jgi:tRNA pseudouridine38/39 synthase
VYLVLDKLFPSILEGNFFLNLKKSHPTNEIDYLKMLNGVLPNDIYIRAWTPVKINFNARFDCIYRKYKYYFILEDMDLDLMKKSSQKYVGKHNFINFCKINETEKKFERR